MSGYKLQDTTKVGAQPLTRVNQPPPTATTISSVSPSAAFLAHAPARHDFAVALQRDALAREVQPLDEFAAVQRALELMGFAVDGQCDHFGFQDGLSS